MIFKGRLPVKPDLVETHNPLQFFLFIYFTAVRAIGLMQYVLTNVFFSMIHCERLVLEYFK